MILNLGFRFLLFHILVFQIFCSGDFEWFSVNCCFIVMIALIGCPLFVSLNVPLELIVRV